MLGFVKVFEPENEEKCFLDDCLTKKVIYDNRKRIENYVRIYELHHDGRREHRKVQDRLLKVLQISKEMEKK